MKNEEIQKIVENYWVNGAEGYSDRIKGELCSPLRDVWREEIAKHMPNGDALDILDIGTGPGFFSIILAMSGHKTTGIDCTDEMLNEARMNAKNADVEANFSKMDAHTLFFQNDSFDLVICRNVTWSLYDPEKAYLEWRRVLRPGGRLLIFDSNWGHKCYFEEVRMKTEENEKCFREKFGEIPLANKVDESYIDKMFLSDKIRPTWDKEVLSSLGFSVYTKENLSESLWDEQTKLVYGATPMFLIVAEKKEE